MATINVKLKISDALRTTRMSVHRHVAGRGERSVEIARTSCKNRVIKHESRHKPDTFHVLLKRCDRYVTRPGDSATEQGEQGPDGTAKSSYVGIMRSSRRSFHRLNAR